MFQFLHDLSWFFKMYEDKVTSTLKSCELVFDAASSHLPHVERLKGLGQLVMWLTSPAN